MLEFVGQRIPGIHGRVQTGPPLLHVARTKFAGLRGETEIDLEHGGRPLEVHIWLNDASFTSRGSLQNLLEQLDDRVGENGRLLVTHEDSTLRQFELCTFEGFLPDSDVLPAIGAGMPAGTYFCSGLLRWWQLVVVGGVI